jgi:hypothetical protein
VVFENEERFSHGGAADGTLSVGSAAGDRAGKRKTCWTKPLSEAPGLWAFNAPQLFCSAPDRGFPFGGLVPFVIPIGVSSCQWILRQALALLTGSSATYAAQANWHRSGG